MKKALSLLMTAAAVVGVTSTAAFASQFSDTKGHWAESSIDRWSGYGVVNGHGNGTFSPNANMSRAEMAQTYVNLLQLTEKADISRFTDVDPDAWYADAIAKCVAAGILNGTSDTTISPQGTVDREQMFVSFGRAMGLKPVENTDSSLSDLGDVSDWAEGMVNALLEAGYVNGMEDNTLRPQADINRASVMSLMDQTVAGYGNESGSVLEMNGQKGLVLVVTDDVTVTGQVGDLVIAPGAAEGTVTLKDATVTGTVTLSAADSQLKITGETKVDNVVVNAEAQGAEVSVDKAASVGSLTSQADQVVVSGQGKVDSAVVSGNNTQINTDGTKLEVSEGTTGTTQNGNKVEGGSTVDTGKPSEGGSTGGSGGGSGSSHTHSYVDGVCEKDGSIDPTYAQANTAEALTAALAAGKNVVITGSIGSPEENTIYEVNEAVTIRGTKDAVVHGSFVVTADGVKFRDMTIQNPGLTDGMDAYKNAINAYTKEITLQDCTFVAGASFANGVVLFPSDATVNFSISGNTFEGYNKGDGSWSTTGLMITGEYAMSGKPFFGVEGTSVHAANVNDEALIGNNTYINCANGYVRNTWASSEVVYAALNYKAFSRAAENAVFYFNDEDLDFTSTQLSQPVTVVMLAGSLHVDANADKLPENLTVKLQGGDLTAMGTAADNQEETLVLFGSSKTARFRLEEGAIAEIVFHGADQKPQITIHGSVTIPAGQTAYTHFGSEGNIVGADITIDGDLTVDGTLKVTSANGDSVSGSSLTVNGDMIVSGTVTKASKGQLTVTGSTTGQGEWPGKETEDNEVPELPTEEETPSVPTVLPELFPETLEIAAN